MNKDIVPLLTPDVLSRFHDKYIVTESDRCWNWKAAVRNEKGQAAFAVTHSIIIYAYRLAYYLKYGEFDYSLMVCHHCDNPLCVNPSHLFVGTAKDNVQDMISKDRHGGGCRPGEEHPMHVLRECDVLDMFYFQRKGLSQKDIGKMFGVCQPQVSKILNGKKWAYIHEQGLV